MVNWPIERILISYFGNAYVRRVTGLRVTDTTGGFRCMRRELLERIGIERVRANGYAFQIELNYRFARAGARVMEIPFFFLDRRRGTSKLTLADRLRGDLDRAAAARRGRAGLLTAGRSLVEHAARRPTRRPPACAS